MLDNATIIEWYIESFDTKITDLNNKLDPIQDYTNANVLIVLENESKQKEEMFIIDDDKTTSDSRKRKSNKLLKTLELNSEPVKSKNGYICTQCQVVLKSWKEWKIHKTKNHLPVCTICLKKFQSFKLLNAHYKIHNKVICRICDALMSDTDLKDHLKSNHISIIHSCEECDAVFYNETALTVHMKVIHESESENAQCIMCLKDFNKDTLVTHNCKYKCPECTEMPCIHHKYLISCREQILKHVTKIKCIDCDYVCRKRSLLITHANRDHLNYHPFTCNYCSMQYYSKTSLRKHIVDVHPETYVCELCHQDFNIKKEFDNHTLTCVPGEKEYVCRECSALFDSLEEFSSHVELQHSEFLCDMCPKKFDSEANLKAHKDRRHRTVQMVNRSLLQECTVCDIKFDTKGEFLNHMKTHGPSVKFPCKICNIKLENKQKLIYHNRSHYKKFRDLETAPDLPKTVLSIFKCKTCSKRCPTEEALEQHSAVHLKMVKCYICQKMVKESSLSLHLKRHKMKSNLRTRIRKHKCDSCSYSALSKENLEAHTNRYHLKIKPYVCYVCGVAYCGQGQLSEHMRSHSESGRFTCHICNKKLLHKKGLRNHLMIHTGEKPVLCDACGKGFKTMSLMKEHRVIHNGNNIDCPLCDEKFYALRNIREHFKRVHWKWKDRKFDPREVEGLAKEHYHLFQDKRKAFTDYED